MSLTFQQVIHASLSRTSRWHPNGVQDWSPLEWAGAMAGEAGEACNAAKKLKRIADRLQNINLEPGRSLTECESASRHVGREVADTILYGLLLAVRVGVDLESTLIEVFNQKSEEYGFPERIGDEESRWRSIASEAQEDARKMQAKLERAQAEIWELRARRDKLLEANTDEVMRRRKAESRANQEYSEKLLLRGECIRLRAMVDALAAYIERSALEHREPLPCTVEALTRLKFPDEPVMFAEMRAVVEAAVEHTAAYQRYLAGADDRQSREEMIITGRLLDVAVARYEGRT